MSFMVKPLLVASFVIFDLGLRLLNRPTILFAAKARNRPGNKLASLPFVMALTLQFLFVATTAHGQVASPDQQRQALGSLNSAGEVYVNESRAPSELTVFPGDTLRTGDTGTAVLTTSENNSFQIAHQSQLVFSGDPHYFAELKSGMISVKTLGGASGAVVRAGNFVIVPTNRNERTTATIQGVADGSFLVSCSLGNVGVIPLQQAPGLFLQAGQSARITSRGELVSLGTSTQTSAQSAGRNRRLWVYLGVAGGAVAAGTVAAIVLEENHAPVSPVAP